MKNLRKLLAVIITVAMLVTFMVPAFAEEPAMTDAEICETLGMLKGEGDGVTADYLAKQPTRMQAAIMFLRLQGLETEALAYEGEDNFADADLVWAGGQAILSYLKANPDLGFIGIGDNKFDPLGSITAQAYYKVLLTALGYEYGVDFTWSEVIEFAAGVGLAAVADVEDFTVDDLAIATVEALKATVAAGDVTLTEQLVADGVIAEEDAIATGLIVPVIPFGVAGAASTNLKEIVVTFTTAVTAAQAVVGNFTVDGVAPDAVTLSADGMSVTLSINEAIAAAATNAHDYALVVKKEIGLAANVSKTVRTIDASIPVATAVVLTGPTSFDVIFSEPIENVAGGAVLVNNGIYGAVAAAPAGNKVSVTLGSTLADGNYTVKVAGYKDYAGFTMDTVELTLAYAKNLTPLAVTITSAEQNKVVVTFNKKIATTLNANHFYHTFSAWVPNSISTTDNTSYTLNFGTFTIPQGAFSLVVKATDGVTKVTDVWGVDLGANQTLVGSVTADTTAPTVAVKEVVDEQNIKVEYSEAVLGATTSGNYVIKNAAGTAVAITSVTPVSGNIYNILLTAKAAGGAYTVTVSNVTDAALTANTIVPVTLAFNITDKTAPIVSAISYVNTAAGTPEYLYITFNEPMATSGVGSVLDTNNYRLDGVAATAVAEFGTNKYKVSFADGAVFDTKVFIYGQLADATGNKMANLSTSVTLAAAANAEVGPSIVSMTTKSLNTLQIIVDKVVPTVSAADISITNAGNTAGAAMVSYTNDGSKTTIIVTLTSTTAFTDTNDLPNSVDIAAGKLVSDTGMGNLVINYVGTVDGMAPSITAVAQIGLNRIKITLDEAVSITNAALAATEFVLVDKDAKTLVAGVDYQVNDTVANDAELEIQLIGTYAGYNGKLTVDTKDAITYIYDFDGANVKVNAIGAAKEIAAMDILGPVASIPASTNATTNDADSLVISLSEALYDTATHAAIADGADVAAAFTPSAGLTITSAIYDLDTKTITLVLAGTVDTSTLIFALTGYEDVLNIDAAANVTYTYAATGTEWN